MVLTQEGLDEALIFWKKLLSLSDWDIKIKWVNPGDLESCQGDHRFFLAQRFGEIRIANGPQELRDLNTWNPEFTLIHELLHLPLSLISEVSRVEFNELLEEKFINDIARGLLKLRTAAAEAYSHGQEDSSNNGKRRKRGIGSSRKKTRKSSWWRGKGSSIKSGKGC